MPFLLLTPEASARSLSKEWLQQHRDSRLCANHAKLPTIRPTSPRAGARFPTARNRRNCRRRPRYRHRRLLGYCYHRLVMANIFTIRCDDCHAKYCMIYQELDYTSNTVEICVTASLPCDVHTHHPRRCRHRRLRCSPRPISLLLLPLRVLQPQHFPPTRNECTVQVKSGAR